MKTISMINLDKIREPAFGVILSFTSWEVWQSLFISLFIAFIGGFLAAMGRQVYRNYYEKRKKGKK
jgi:nitrate/nitrite transporter NarK